MGTRRWQMSANTEILLMSAVGVGSTMMEATLSGLKENLSQVWEMNLHGPNFSTYQQIIKSVISGIVLIRGFTAHLCLASYLLLIYPVVMEKLRSMLLFWLLLSGLRSVLLNLAAALVGCALCSACSELKPSCFEFVAVKAFELACSVYMWVNVNDFYHGLKKEHRVVGQVQTAVAGPSTAGQDMSESSSSLEEDEWSLPQSFLEELSSDEAQDLSVDSVLAKAMVDWFIKKVEKLKARGELLGRTADRLERMTPAEVRGLQLRVRDSIAEVRPKEALLKASWAAKGLAADTCKADRLDEILYDTIYNEFDLYRTVEVIDLREDSRSKDTLKEDRKLSQDPSESSSSQLHYIVPRLLRIGKDSFHGDVQQLEHLTRSNTDSASQKHATPLIDNKNNLDTKIETSLKPIIKKSRESLSPTQDNLFGTTSEKDLSVKFVDKYLEKENKS